MTASQQNPRGTGLATPDATLQGSTSAALVGETVTMTGVVWSTADNSPASGTVALRDGATTLTTATLDARGTTTFSTAWSRAGSHSLTLSYSGSGSLASSVSVPFSVTVEAVDAQTVQQNVVDLLGRFATRADLSSWTPVYDASGDRAVAADLVASTECVDGTLTAVYATLLHAPIPSASLQAYASDVSAGMTYEAIETTIAGSSTYYQNRGGGTDSGFVRALYNDILYRAPTSSELSTWDAQLSGGTSDQTIASEIMSSSEALADRVNILYERRLRRPATSTELATWVPQLQARTATDQQVIVSLLGSGEYQTWVSTQPRGWGAQPFGTLSITNSTATGCTYGPTCEAFSLTCPGLQPPVSGLLDLAPATVAPARGVVLFLNGGGGEGEWANSTIAKGMLDTVRANGIATVQVSFDSAWNAAASGEDAGFARLGCRPAAVALWVHDNIYAPLGVNPGSGQCGYCLTGTSGGSSAVATIMSNYDVDRFVNAAFPTTGPVWAALAKACLPVRQGSDPQYAYPDPGSEVDTAYAYVTTGGPCDQQYVTFAPQLNFHSVDLNGFRYHHPSLRIGMIIGGKKIGAAPSHARDFQARLIAAGTPSFSFQVIADMTVVGASQTGLDALKSLILEGS